MKFDKEKVKQILHADSLASYKAQTEQLSRSDFSDEEWLEAVLEVLKSKNYDLTKPKFCLQCGKVAKTYWELESCEKNPDGLLVPAAEHGNEIGGMPTCEDDYCHPEYTEVDDSDITEEFVKEHSVHERCSKCHQFMESMG